MIEERRLIDNFITLTSIDAESGQEDALRIHLTDALARLGITARTDDLGNLFARIPAAGAGRPVLFSAHMDTVRPGQGKKAVMHPNGRITSDGTTVLGADDACAIAAILEALTVIYERALPHPEIELLFTVGEELYGVGSAGFDYSKIHSDMAFALDLTGRIGTAAVAAPTILSLDISVRGKSAHAGFAPETGVNALSIAAEALSHLSTGRVAADTTVNFGTIEGGTGKNIVPGRIHITGEVRSLCHGKALQEVGTIEKAFRSAAGRLGGEAEIKFTEKIHAYRIEEHAPVVERLRTALSALDWGEPTLVETFGGSDNNHFVKHGLSGIVLASAMELVHTTEEYTEIPELVRCAELTLQLMTMEE